MLLPQTIFFNHSSIHYFRNYLHSIKFLSLAKQAILFFKYQQNSISKIYLLIIIRSQFRPSLLYVRSFRRSILARLCFSKYIHRELMVWTKSVIYGSHTGVFNGSESAEGNWIKRTSGRSRKIIDRLTLSSFFFLLLFFFLKDKL